MDLNRIPFFCSFHFLILTLCFFLVIFSFSVFLSFYDFLFAFFFEFPFLTKKDRGKNLDEKEKKKNKSGSLEFLFCNDVDDFVVEEIEEVQDFKGGNPVDIWEKSGGDHFLL